MKFLPKLYDVGHGWLNVLPYSSVALIGLALGFLFARATLTPHSFTLTVSGTAYDPHHKYISVVLTLTSTVNGDIKKALQQYVHGGTLTVKNYGTFTISGARLPAQSHTSNVRQPSAIRPLPKRNTDAKLDA